MASRRLFACLVALVACACGGSTGSQDGLDAQLRLATDPGDVKAHRSVARLAYAEARPGEVVRSLLLVETLAGLTRAERTLLGQLLSERGTQRLQLGDADALADFEHALKLDADVSVQTLLDAYAMCAVVALRHSSAFRHSRAAPCLEKLSAQHVYRRHRDLPSLDLEELAQLFRWFESHGAKRRALGIAQEYVDRGGREQGLLATWQRLHRWWYGSTRPLMPVTAAVSAGSEPTALQRFSEVLGSATSPWKGTSSLALTWNMPSWESSEKALVEAYHRDPALADRLAKRFLDGDVYGLPRAAFLCELFFALGDKNRAQQWSHTMLEIAPTLPASHEAVGLAHAWLGDVPRADVFFTTAAAASGDAGRQWAFATLAYRRSGQLLAAVAAGRKAIGLTAQGWDVHLLLEVSMAQRGLHREEQADATRNAVFGRFAPSEVEAAKELVSRYIASVETSKLRSLLGPIRERFGFAPAVGAGVGKPHL